MAGCVDCVVFTVFSRGDQSRVLFFPRSDVSAAFISGEEAESFLPDLLSNQHHARAPVGISSARDNDLICKQSRKLPGSRKLL